MSDGQQLLLFGGNGFLGLEFVEAALQRQPSYQLTVAHRGHAYWDSEALLGQSPLRVRQVLCDRGRMEEACTAQLRDRVYDWIIDFSARGGDDVRKAVAALAGRYHGYVLISSSIVYVPFEVPFAALSARPFSERDVVGPAQRSWLARAIASSDSYMSGKLGAEDALFVHLNGTALGAGGAGTMVGARQDPCHIALRLPYVLGRRDSTFRLAQLLLLHESGRLPLSRASRVPISFVDAASVASALLWAISTTHHRSTHKVNAHGGVSAPSRSPQGGAPSHTLCGLALNVAQPPIALADVLRAATTAADGRPTWPAWNMTHMGRTPSLAPGRPLWWEGTAATSPWFMRRGGRLAGWCRPGMVSPVALLTPTSAERVYDAVAFARLLPFTLSTAAIRSLGWTPERALRDAVAEAAAFARRELLLNRTRFPRERAILSDKLARGAGVSAEMQAVLHSYNLLPASDALRVVFDPTETKTAARYHTFPRPLRPCGWRLWAFGVPLGALCAACALHRTAWRAFASRAACAAICSWWVAALLSGGSTGLVRFADDFSYDLGIVAHRLLDEKRGLWPNANRGMASEVIVGAFVLGAGCVAACSRPIGQSWRAARLEAMGDLEERLFLYAHHAILTYYFLRHKLAGRFFGEGVGLPWRMQVECTLPMIFVSHEPFSTWTQALYVLSIYTTAICAASLAVRTALGLARRAQGPRWPFAGLVLQPLCLVSLFETHHVPDLYKMTVPAGPTSCVFIALMWLLFAPLLVVVSLRIGPARRAAAAADNSGRATGLAVKEEHVGAVTPAEMRALTLAEEDGEPSRG